jgi:16S rRNA (guanine527-N7)-methyltransferase
MPQLRDYLDLLVAWNQRLDLTAARTPDELVDLTLADALVIARSRPPSGRYIDVGSGAGAPALPLALMCPELKFTLVEPKAKRVAFLRTALGSLGITNVSVLRGRSEVVQARSFDVALSRATLSPTEWLSEGARLATQAVWVLLARGAVPELAGWRVSSESSYRWPLTDAERRALRFERQP